MKTMNSIEKRDLLASKKFDAEEVKFHADEFLQAERYGDAFAFFAKLDDRDGVQSVKKAVIRIGDPEVLWRIAHRYETMVTREDWLECGRAAMEMGKHRSALFAFEKAENSEGVAAAERAINPASEAPQPPAAPAQQ